MAYPKSTATYKVCQIVQAGNLPMSRTTGGAPVTRAWRAKVSWYRPKKQRNGT